MLKLSLKNKEDFFENNYFALRGKVKNTFCEFTGGRRRPLEMEDPSRGKVEFFRDGGSISKKFHLIPAGGGAGGRRPEAPF